VRGERGLIGFIDLSTARTLLSDVFDMLPTDIGAVCSRIELPGGVVTPGALAAMVDGDALETSVRGLVAAGPSVISFACTSGSLIKGVGYDSVLSKRIAEASGAIGTTTTTAVMDAFAALGAASVAVGTPYIDSVNDAERQFLEDSGISVPRIVGLDLEDDTAIGRVHRDAIVALADRLADADTDVIFLSCTNLDAAGVVQALEERCGKPVVTSNQATIWQALRLAGVDDILPGFGQLCRLPLVR